MANNNIVTINDTKYNEKDLTQKAQKTVLSLKVTNQEIQRLEDKLAILQTARNAYSASLTPNLPKPAAANKRKDVVKINDKKYAYADMNEKAVADINSIAIVDKKIADLQADLAITKTAKTLYSKSLIEEVK